MIETRANFALQLRTLREAHGYSVKVLAQRVGVSSVTIWKWERGEAKPRPSLLLSLAKALDVTPIELSTSSKPIANLARRSPARSPQSDTAARGDVTASGSAEALPEVIARAKQMIADASGTNPNNVTILIEY